MKIDNMKEYVISLKEEGKEAYAYKKFAKVQAVRGVVGQEVITTMKNGLVETKNVVSTDEKTGLPDYIVTNPSGEQYLVKDSTFNKKYEIEDKENNVFRAKGGIQVFMQIDEDVTFVAPWGEEMTIKKGGYLNITNPTDIYGVQEDEFNETYAEVDENGDFKDNKYNNVSFDFNKQEDVCTE